MKRLAALFWELFRISLLVVGGGYAIIVVADQVFARRKWIREGELLEQLPLFQMVPGLIATHSAVYIGNRLAGTLGAAVGVVAVAIPSVVIFILVSVGYASLPLGSGVLAAVFAGLRASLAGIIAAAVLRSAQQSLVSPFAWGLMLASLLAMTVGGVAVPWVLLAAMAAGVGAENVVRTRGRKLGAIAWPLLLFMKYGLLGFGGGFVLVPMYLEDFVGPSAPYLQIGHELFSNIMAIAQMTPGPVGVNCATFFGYRLAGVPGALIASGMLLLPGSVLMLLALKSLNRFRKSLIVRGIMRGVRPASVSLMLIALWVFARSSFTGPVPAVLALAVGGLAYFRKVQVTLLIPATALASVLIYYAI